MQGKYAALTESLAKRAALGQESVELDFDTIADLVGGLPPTASIRQFWANNSQTQAQASKTGAASRPPPPAAGQHQLPAAGRSTG